MEPEESSSGGAPATSTSWRDMASQVFVTDPKVNGNCFADKPVKMKAPEEVACFSWDENRELHLDDRSMCYYFNPSPRDAEKMTNLGDGFENFRQFTAGDSEHLSALLAAIIDKEKRENAKFNVNFVSFRGMMTNLLTLPYAQRDEWYMNLTFFDGTVFIDEDKVSSSKWNPRQGNSSRLPEHHPFYGFKFETLYTIPDIWDNVSRDEIESRNEKQVSNYAQYCSIVKTSIGETSMVIGGEVDCIWDSKLPGATKHQYIELKTTEWIDPDLPRHVIEKKRHNYDFRKLKYWAQSYLIGNARIVVGKRWLRNNRLMMPLDVLHTLDIPKTVHSWDARVCKQTWAALLEWVYEKVKGSEGVWKLYKLRNEGQVRLVHVEPTGTGEILTAEFIAHRQSMNSSTAGAQANGTDGEAMEGVE
ncbi:hypothetical protein B0J12DRAFT_743917 [Macrophomina phaseolina]|uniref:Decapping nuclease n=1 Tax=Macrophomina phaseolina TaxID=35725 RepID=A0ABQ8FZM7_9PEZI|nr:hypothetical protein B0J12DRAFT_743917 [Macrophomina phaseolina]